MSIYDIAYFAGLNCESNDDTDAEYCLVRDEAWDRAFDGAEYDAVSEDLRAIFEAGWGEGLAARD